MMVLFHVTTCKLSCMVEWLHRTIPSQLLILVFIKKHAIDSTSLTLLLLFMYHILFHPSYQCSLTVDSHYQRLALGGKDFYVSMWDLEDMSCRYTIAME